MKRKKGFSVYLVFAMLVSSLAMLAPSVSAAPGPWIAVEPAKTEFKDANYCDSNNTVFTVKINVYNITNLYGYDIVLYYNSSHLENTANTEKGTGQVCPVNTAQYTYADLSTPGTVSISVAFLEAMGALVFNGNGTLIWMTFKIIYCPPQNTGVPGGYTWENTTLDISAGETFLYNKLGGTIVLDSMDDGEVCHGTADLVPGAPTADFTWSPTYPEPCMMVTLTDKSTPGPPGSWIVSWTWVITGPADGFGPLYEPDTWFHCNGSGTVTVTLTVVNNFGLPSSVTKYIEQIEVEGCRLDVYTAPNRFCNQTTPNVGLGIGENCDAFSPGVNMTIYVNVTYNGKPVMHVFVGIEVLLELREISQYPERIYEPVNECIAYRVAETDKYGIAKTWLRIPHPCKPENSTFGKWLVIAKAKVQDVVQTDIMRFDVGWVITLHEVWPLKEQEGIWERADKFYAPCDWMGFEIELKNIMWINKSLTLVAVVYDDCDVPLGQYIFRTIIEGGEWCKPNTVKVVIAPAIHLPQWTYVGFGKVYVTAFTLLPHECGIPYCPEIGKEFTLEWSGLYE